MITDLFQDYSLARRKETVLHFCSSYSAEEKCLWSAHVEEYWLIKKMNLLCNEHCSIYSCDISTHKLIFSRHKLRRATCPVPWFLNCMNQAVLHKALRGPEMHKVQYDIMLALKKWNRNEILKTIHGLPIFLTLRLKEMTRFKLHRAGFKAGTHL